MRATGGGKQARTQGQGRVTSNFKDKELDFAINGFLQWVALGCKTTQEKLQYKSYNKNSVMLRIITYSPRQRAVGEATRWAKVGRPQHNSAEHRLERQTTVALQHYSGLPRLRIPAGTPVALLTTVGRPSYSPQGAAARAQSPPSSNPAAGSSRAGRSRVPAGQQAVTALS